MHALYYELWDKRLTIIKKFKVKVPPSNYGLRPGYKIDLNLSTIQTLISPEFESKREEHIFQKVVVKAHLPCGVDRLLVRPEYVDLRHKLMQGENKRWAGAAKYSASNIPGV